MAENYITAERLRELLHYDPDTGLFTFRIDRGRRKAGQKTGCLRYDGYIVIRLHSISYLAHRLAWMYVHGRWPENEIDHIDMTRSNNRLANLRDVSTSVNGQNRKAAQRNNTTGLLGVARSGNYYVALIKHGGQSHYLGSFRTKEEAHARYIEEKRKHHPGGLL